MTLKSLKKRPEQARISSESVTADPYGWGMRIDLDSDTLENLGFIKLPEVGSRISIKAIGRVIATRGDVEGEMRNVELQLTDMDAVMMGSFEELSEDD